MNGRQSKKMRREASRLFAKWKSELNKLPFRERLKLAWFIVTKT